MQNNNSNLKSKDGKNRTTTLIACALIIILGLAVYSNSLNGEFVWDDIHLIRDNVYLKNWSNFTKIFTQHMEASGGRKYSSYRPLQIFTYMLDYSLWGLKVQGYHLTNTVLHILVALSLFWLVNLLFDNCKLGLLTSTLFLTHPIHTEAVTYISGRADPLATLFMLLCLVFYIKQLHTEKLTFFILTCASFILALLSRENSLILPILLLLYHYSFKERVKAKQFLPIIVITFIYLLLRFTLLSSSLAEVPSSNTLWQRLPGFFVAIANYLRLLMLPLNLHMEYGNNLFNFANPKVILGIIILSLLSYSLKIKKTKSLAFFSISWFLISLLPQSNLYPINAYMAEHWLYLPSIGFFLIISQTIIYLLNTKNLKAPFLILTILLVSFYSFLTLRQNNYWKDPVTFYEKTLKYAPDSPRVYNNLGKLYGEQGKNEKAVALLKKAIQIKPDYIEAYNNLGAIYFELGKKEEAIGLLKKAIDFNPNFAKAYRNLAAIYFDLGKKQETEEAIDLFKKTIYLNPDFVDAYYKLGNAYHKLGKNKDAIASYEKAIQINPNFAEAYNNLGNIFYETGKEREAVILYKKAIASKSDYPEPYNNLSTVYFHQKQYKLAIEYCDKAKELGFVNQDLLEALAPYRNRR